MKKCDKKMPEWALPVLLGIGAAVMIAGAVVTGLVASGKISKAKFDNIVNKYKSKAALLGKEIAIRLKDFCK